jgi:hypothetical protein
MSHTERPISRPRPGPDWVVQDVRPCTAWREGTDECAACGADVNLSGDHYGMELLRQLPTGGKRGLERERFVFCSERCVDAWQRD